MIYGEFRSPIGKLYLTFQSDKLARVETERPLGVKPGKVPEKFIAELSAYFEGRLGQFGVETVFLSGTEFERKVWASLRDIPYGETRSYKWLAEHIGSPLSQRAVGQALGKNPIPIVIPCHRVIESGGRLGGYTGGEALKRRLLELEYYNRGRILY